MTPSSRDIFNRAELLLGADVMERLASVRVILFGVGGVGSWCAEGLVRSGVRHLTIVDADDVVPSNINRQRMATVSTVGRSKVEALKEILLDINPEASVETIHARFTEASAASFELENYDYIIDAIDALKDKAALILRATATPATFFSSMGAACKIDPNKIRVASFWEVRGCPLGAMLRKKLRKAGTLPAKDFLCVYDEELLPNRGADTALEEELKFDKVSHNGSLITVTAPFGFTLASLVIEDLMSLPAVRADSFQEIIDGPGRKAFGYGNRRDGRVFEAESAVALLAVEMDVDIVVLVIVVAVTEFVADTVARVVQHVHQMGLAERLQGPENIGFVDGLDNRLQLGHGHRTDRCSESAGDDDAVCRRLDAVAFHEFQQVFFFHTVQR